jgi:hypothetical protein
MSEKDDQSHESDNTLPTLQQSADEAARHVGNVHLTFVLLCSCTYIALIISATPDEQLLRVGPVTLRILDVKLQFGILIY